MLLSEPALPRVSHKTYESTLMQSISQLSVVHIGMCLFTKKPVPESICPIFDGPVASTRGQQVNLFQPESVQLRSVRMLLMVEGCGEVAVLPHVEVEVDLLGLCGVLSQLCWLLVSTGVSGFRCCILRIGK